MNQVRRGDALAVVCAVLVFVFSFLPQVSIGSYEPNLWHRGFLLAVCLIPLLALVVVALIALPLVGSARSLPLSNTHQLIVAGSALVAFSAVVELIANDNPGYGAVLMMVFGLALVAVVWLTDQVAELRAPLTSAAPQRRTES